MMHRIFFAFIWIIGRVLLWIYRVDVKGLENLPKHSAVSYTHLTLPTIA